MYYRLINCEFENEKYEDVECEEVIIPAYERIEKTSKYDFDVGNITLITVITPIIDYKCKRVIRVSDDGVEYEIISDDC